MVTVAVILGMILHYKAIQLAMRAARAEERIMGKVSPVIPLSHSL